MTQQEQIEVLLAEKAALTAELVAATAAKKQAFGKLSFKVSAARKPGTNGPDDKGTEGGAVSVYGLGRFPVTLYREQWERLIDAIPELEAFITANLKILHVKKAA